MDGNAGHVSPEIPIDKADARPLEIGADHIGDMLDIERTAQWRIAHRLTRAIGDLTLLQHEFRIGKFGTVACMVIMHMGDDHGLDLFRRHADGRQCIHGFAQHDAPTFIAGPLVETKIDDNWCGSRCGSPIDNRQ